MHTVSLRHWIPPQQTDWILLQNKIHRNPILFNLLIPQRTPIGSLIPHQFPILMALSKLHLNAQKLTLLEPLLLMYTFHTKAEFGYRLYLTLECQPDPTEQAMLTWSIFYSNPLKHVYAYFLTVNHNANRTGTNKREMTYSRVIKKLVATTNRFETFLARCDGKPFFAEEQKLQYFITFRPSWEKDT